jgi:hypothetical protein
MRTAAELRGSFGQLQAGVETLFQRQALVVGGRLEGGALAAYFA